MLRRRVVGRECLGMLSELELVNGFCCKDVYD